MQHPDTAEDRHFSHRLARGPRPGVVDGPVFRSGMRALAGGVTVLTTGPAHGRAGLTATAVCALSSDPPRLLACVNRSGGSFDAIRRHGRLAVNVLCVGQRPIAERFSGPPADGADRFSAGPWRQGLLDVPVLDGACAVFECEVAEIIDAVSHGLVIGDIMAVSTQAEVEPLVYCAGRFARLAAAPPHA